VLQTIFEKAEKIFFNVCEKELNKVAFGLSSSINQPQVSANPLLAQIPLPVESKNGYSFFGKTFNLNDTDTLPLWSLFLASIYHVAAHIAMTDFSMYDEWRRGKNETLAQRAINFVEDKRAEAYLQSFYPEIWESIKKINDYFDLQFNVNDSQRKNATEHFRKFFHINEGESNSLFEKIILVSNDDEKTIELVNHMYHNKNLLPTYEYPYCDQICLDILSYELPRRFDTTSDFQKMSAILQEMWVDREARRLRILRRYRKYSKDLQFDKIVFNGQNFREYFKLKEENSLLIKKIKSQIESVSNIVDDPTPNDKGLIEMQRAIQAVAAKDPRIPIFEQGKEKRSEESWAILMDTSASMKLSFKEYKKFALCLSEAANTLNSRYGKWAMFCYDNKFHIVKDGTERYNQEVKSRIGGIKNGGLSFIPDAITLTTRLLMEDNNQRKFIFLITDGKSLGYDKVDKKLESALNFAQENGVKVVGIGIPDEIKKYFSASFDDSDTRKAVANFINSYVSVINRDF